MDEALKKVKKKKEMNIATYLISVSSSTITSQCVCDILDFKNFSKIANVFPQCPKVTDHNVITSNATYMYCQKYL